MKKRKFAFALPLALVAALILALGVSTGSARTQKKAAGSRPPGSTSVRTTIMVGQATTGRPAACPEASSVHRRRMEIRPRRSAGRTSDREPHPGRQQDHLCDLVRLPESDGRCSEEASGREVRDGDGHRAVEEHGGVLRTARTPSTSRGWPQARRRRRVSSGTSSRSPIPEVIRHANAFALGAQATHPGAKVKLIWTNAWLDLGKEKKAAQNLMQAEPT